MSKQTFLCSQCPEQIDVAAPTREEAEKLLPNHGWWVIGRPGHMKQYAHDLECRKAMPGYVEQPMGVAMRVNIYAEEMTDRVEIVEKAGFTGLRLYLELPVTVGHAEHSVKQVQGPFMHHPGDDDSAAITFWGKRSLIPVLRKMQAMLLMHYNKHMTAQVEENHFGLQVQDADGSIVFTKTDRYKPVKWEQAAISRSDAINLAAWISFLTAGETEIRQALDRILMQKARDQNANT